MVNQCLKWVLDFGDQFSGYVEVYNFGDQFSGFIEDIISVINLVGTLMILFW